MKLINNDCWLIIWKNYVNGVKELMKIEVRKNYYNIVESELCFDMFIELMLDW